MEKSISFLPLLSERGSSKIQNNQNPSLHPKNKNKNLHTNKLSISPQPQLTNSPALSYWNPKIFPSLFNFRGSHFQLRMYIKEICLEGFKSYATRTVVQGFDPFFNAITGLNGSGKSNILDSICFVLGITNLQQVRASNLQELVYKQGQAGITKATVSIVFDNSDRNRSPLGYEDHSEITVTRQVSFLQKSNWLLN
jgi:hypothetical protein